MPSVYKWRQAIDGGGFQNAFAIADNTVHTSYTNVAISGADVAGFHRTTNRNSNVIWGTSYRGIFNANQNCTTAMQFSSHQDGKLFVLTGRSGTGGLLISEDAGINWVESGLKIGGNSDTIKEGGMNSSREVGRHICVDSTGNHLWVAGMHVYGGTKRWGIAHSSDQGSTFTGGVGFAMQGYAVSGTGIAVNATVRFIVQHPTDSNILYVGVDGIGGGPYTAANNCGGLYKITNAKTNTPVVSKIAGPGASDLSTRNWMRDGIIIKEGANYFLYFIAGSKTGTGASAHYSEVNVFKYALAAGGGFVNLAIEDEGLRTDSQWVTMDGYRNATDTATTLWIGCWQGTDSTKTNTGVAVSRNGGNTWNSLVGANYPTISASMPSGRDYWMFENENFRFNKSNYDCACIRIDPNNRSRVFCAGRGGIWCTTDDGATWRPAMEGLGASMSQDVAYNPANVNQWSQGNVDWATMLSRDRFQYGTKPFGKSAPGTKNTGYAFHWTGDGLAIATGGRGGSQDNPNGVVMTSADPINQAIENQNWQTSVNFTVRPRVVGIASGRDSSNNRVLIAIAQKRLSSDDGASTGIWRKVITSGTTGGTWSRVKPEAFSGLGINNSLSINVFWPAGSSYIYTYDRGAGKVWRSHNHGSDWVNVWTCPSSEASKREAGYLAGTNENILYIGTGSNIYKVTNATGAFTPTTLSKPAGLTSPGPIATDTDGNLYATQRFITGKPTGLWMYPVSGGTTEKLSTIEFEQKVVMPNNMTVLTETVSGAKKRTIGISTWGNALFIGEAGAATPSYEEFAENFENGGTPPAAGTAISTSNSSFGAVSGGPTFSATSKEEERSGAFAVGATAGSCYAESQALDPKPQYAIDFYFQVTDLPSANTRIVALLDGAGSSFTGLQLSTTGKLIIQDGGTAVHTSTATLSINTWYRVAAFWDATSNTCQLKIWTGSNLLASAPTEDSGSKSYANNTNVEKVRVGLLSTALTNSAVLFDDILTKNNGTWPVRAIVDPSHSIILGFIPMGIR